MFDKQVWIGYMHLNLWYCVVKEAALRLVEDLHPVNFESLETLAASSTLSNGLHD